MSNFSIALHGGGGTIDKGQMSAEKEAAYLSILKKSICKLITN